MSTSKSKIHEAIQNDQIILVHLKGDSGQVMEAYGYNTFNSGQMTTMATLSGKPSYNTNSILCRYYEGKIRVTNVFDIDGLEVLA